MVEQNRAKLIGCICEQSTCRHTGTYCVHEAHAYGHEPAFQIITTSVIKAKHLRTFIHHATMCMVLTTYIKKLNI